MATVKDKLISPVAEPAKVPNNKVTVVGVGMVGMAAAVSILARVRLKDSVLSHTVVVCTACLSKGATFGGLAQE